VVYNSIKRPKRKEKNGRTGAQENRDVEGRYLQSLSEYRAQRALSSVSSGRKWRRRAEMERKVSVHTRACGFLRSFLLAIRKTGMVKSS
jgi:hypothetical protein